MEVLGQGVFQKGDYGLHSWQFELVDHDQTLENVEVFLLDGGKHISLMENIAKIINDLRIRP